MRAARTSWLRSFTTESPGYPRLFCFPYAGGGPVIFRNWPRFLPPTTGLYGIQLPGRESRMAETPFTELSPLVDDLSPVLADKVAGSPYVFFGHSLGALVAWAVCRKFRRDRVPLPTLLVVSGASAPHVPLRHPPIHDLPEPEFVAELRRLDGTPDEALVNKELMDLLIPMLRADCAVSETYVFTREAPLPCPILALGGDEDEDVPPDDVEAWRLHTSSRFTCKMFPGGHFFVRTHEPDVVREIARHLKVG